MYYSCVIQSCVFLYLSLDFLGFLVVIGKIVFVFSGDRRSGLERWFNITIHSAILILTKTKRIIITSVIEYLFGYIFIL